MRERHAGSALSATGARCWAIATTSSIVSRRPPIVMAALTRAGWCMFSVRSLSAICASAGARPEIEEVEPLIGRLAAIVLEPCGVALCPRREMLSTVAARQFDALGERLEIQPVATALFQ